MIPTYTSSSFFKADKYFLAQKIRESFYQGKTTECFRFLWICYQEYPHFLPIQPFVRHFKKELAVMKIRNSVLQN